MEWQLLIYFQKVLATYLCCKTYWENGTVFTELPIEDLTTEAYSEPCQTSKMGRFVKIVNRLKSLTIFIKRTILDIWQPSEYAFVVWETIWLPFSVTTYYYKIPKFLFILKISKCFHFIIPFRLRQGIIKEFRPKTIHFWTS